MRMNKYELPGDLVLLALNIVRGYNRRRIRLDYISKAIAEGADVDVVNGKRVGCKGYRGTSSVQGIVVTLEHINALADAQSVFAVEKAYAAIGEGFSAEPRKAIKNAVWDGCTLNKSDFHLNRYDLAISDSGFYRLRRKFLFDVLDGLGYINEYFLAGQTDEGAVSRA